MYKNGVMLNNRTAGVMRFAGFIMPLILFFYGILVQNGIVNDSHYVGNVWFYSIIIPWILLGIFQFLLPSKTQFDAAWRFIAYHIFTGFYVLFVTGLTTPFTASWVLLFLATYAYFSHIGLRLSIGFFVVVALIEIVLFYGNQMIFVTDIMSLLTILIVGIVTIIITHIQEVDEAALIRSKAQQTLQRDRILTLVNNLADAILSTDDKGVIRLYNAASLNLLDTNSSLNGIHIDDALPLLDTKKAPVSLFDSLQKTQSVVVRDDLTMTIGDDTYRLEVTYSPIRSSFSQSKRAQAQDGYILILRDVTKAKSLEEERDEFISVVSHELRTPLTVAEGTISNVQLMMERPDITKNILKNNMAVAHEQVMFLAKMVNDLSTLSRAERGVADAPETIKVRELVDELYKEYAPQATAKKLRFDLDLEPHLGQVAASRLYLKEMLQNFITNSIKYTKKGGIVLRVAPNAKKDKVTFEIKDTGIGISKSDQSKIFNKFYRSEDYRTRETGGTGLGLYVTAKLAAKLGTAIKMHSRLNHGSSFSFTLKTDETAKKKA
jgi:signal transduction histidine kinase